MQTAKYANINKYKTRTNNNTFSIYIRFQHPVKLGSLSSQTPGGPDISSFRPLWYCVWVCAHPSGCAEHKRMVSCCEYICFPYTAYGSTASMLTHSMSMYSYVYQYSVAYGAFERYPSAGYMTRGSLGIRIGDKCTFGRFVQSQTNGFYLNSTHEQ